MALAVSTTEVNLAGLGSLRGLKTSWGRTFLGVPFAEPPVGKHRWRLPRPKQPWIDQGVLNATRFSPHCMQRLGPNNPVWPFSNVSEDCLYLNIYAPPDNVAKLMPVLIYLHGGSFTEGGGRETRLRAGYAVEHLGMSGKHFIIVTCNYRLSIFGCVTPSFLKSLSMSLDTECI